MQRIAVYTDHPQMDDRTKVICHSRDRLRAQLLRAIVNPPRRSLMWKVKDAVEMAWAFVWALTFGGVWVEMGERLGLWERVDNEEDQH